MNEDSSSDEDEDPDNMGVPGKYFVFWMRDNNYKKQ